MAINLCTEDIRFLQQIYTEYAETVDYTSKFGNPLYKKIARLVIQGIEGKNWVWSPFNGVTADPFFVII